MRPILTIFIALILFTSCKKTNSSPLSQLPDTTHIGANTFGCLINGSAYSVAGKNQGFDLSGGIFCVPSQTEKQLYLATGSFLSMVSPWSGTIGTYKMTGNYPYEAYYGEYKLDATHTGAITVTYFDSTIIAGTFYFDCVNDSGQVVHITDGRFDISL